MTRGTSVPFIEVRGLAKRFERKGEDPLVVLQDLTFSVVEGELVMILGPSGCGKTTLLRVIAGLERPSAGAVRVHGEAVTGANADRGMVFQEYTSFPWLSVRGNIEFGLKRAGVPSGERNRVVRRLVDLVGLKPFQQLLPGQLSGGMRQRLAIARSLAMDPSVLLMDEPFGALDAQTRQTLQQEFLSIQRDTGKTVLFVTHDVDEALTLGDRVIVLGASPARVLADMSLRDERGQRLARPDLAAKRREFVELLLPQKLRVGVSDWAGHAPLLWGIAGGTQPPNVEVITGKAEHVRKAGLEAGELSALGITLCSLAVHFHADKGRIVCSTIGSQDLGTDVIVVRAAAVESVEALATARLGFLPRSLEHLVFGCVFDAHGLDLSLLDPGRSEISHCPRKDYVDALLNGAIDAAVLCEPGISEILEAHSDWFRMLPTRLEQALVHQVVFASLRTLNGMREELKAYLKWALHLNDKMTTRGDEILAELHARSPKGIATGFRRVTEDYFLFDNIQYYSLLDNCRFYLEGEIEPIIHTLHSVAARLGVAKDAVQPVAGMIDASLIRELAAESGL